MDPSTLKSLLLPIHGMLGVLSLGAGAVALLAPKRAGLHPQAGRLFVLGMAGTIALAVPVLIATANVFLTGMGLFAAFLTAIGARIAMLRPPRRAATRADRMLCRGMQVHGALFAAYGLLALSRGAVLGAVCLALGLLSLRLGTRYGRFLAAPTGTWISEHLSAMTGAYIAAATAFTAATGTNLWPSVPEPVLWLGPTVVVLPLVHRLQRRVAAAG